MLSVEEQIERIADAAAAQTSPVRWLGPPSTEPAEPSWVRHRRRVVLTASVVLGLVLLGGLVATRGDGTMTPATPSVEPAVIPDTTLPAATTVAPPPNTAAPSSTVAPPSVAVPITTAPVDVVWQEPFAAIDADGNAVMLDPDTNQTAVVFGGPDPGDETVVVERVSVAADGSIAYVGVCCDAGTRTILVSRPPAVATITDTVTDGFAPALNPAATLLATAGPESITITDTASGAAVTLPPVTDDRWGTTVDLAWLDDTTLAVLNQLDTVWTLTIITTDGITSDEATLDPGPTRPFALVSEFPQLQFAGTAIADEIAVHDAGTDRVLSGTIDDYGNINDTGRGSSLQVITLPGDAVSAWYSDPDHLIWIDTNRQLHVDEQLVPGEYTWARR